ncbi:hypothetical protein [Armatimonas rosea]|uniref:Uncharacterized protein n=1 Tax=Armatimonas rosea TaxID=685828 RepID=A0A7W9SPX0_ARMRO|nr:hypothetical protein [Armatimonas rosea]MBB6049973.1 hypothetical protein [Armatimonas rosea]
MDTLIDISDDDLVWVHSIRIDKDIVSTISSILQRPEDKLKPYIDMNDLCESVLLKWAVQRRNQEINHDDAHPCIDVNDLFKSDLLRASATEITEAVYLLVLDFIQGKGEGNNAVRISDDDKEYLRTLVRKKIKEIIENKKDKERTDGETSSRLIDVDDVYLFNIKNPVDIIFMYGDISSFYPYLYGKDSHLHRNRVTGQGVFDHTFPVFKSQSDMLHIQGEYGTNTIRILCPTVIDVINKDSVTTEEILTTITSTNLAYVHFEISHENKSLKLFDEAARLALSPKVLLKTLNGDVNNAEDKPRKKFKLAEYLKHTLVLKGNRGVIPVEDFEEFMERLEFKLKNKVRFDIPLTEIGGCKMLNYQFLFQSQNKLPEIERALYENVSDGKKGTGDLKSTATVSVLELIPCSKNTAMLQSNEIYDLIIRELDSMNFNTPGWQVISDNDGEIVISLIGGQMIKWVGNTVIHVSQQQS